MEFFLGVVAALCLVTLYQLRVTPPPKKKETDKKEDKVGKTTNISITVPPDAFQDSKK